MDRDELLAEWLIRWEEADAATRKQVLAELSQHQPDLAQEFRGLLKSLCLFEESAYEARARERPVRSSTPKLPFTTSRYEAVRKHSEGRTGIVYQARDRHLGRKVALKFLKPHAAKDDTARRQFLHEAEITSRLDHPGIVPVHDINRDAPFYAMRFLHGDNLGKKIDDLHGPGGADLRFSNLDFQRLLRSFLTVCEAVAYAHAQHVIHCDIKPGNIMIGPYGETLLLDWGLARTIEGFETSDPNERNDPISKETPPDPPRFSSQTRGTAAYMSPELARGEWNHVGTHSDIYSLGATLYALLTGKRAYTGQTNFEVAEKAKTGDFPSPSTVKPSVPAALEAICLKAMSKQPHDRYASASHLAQDVSCWLADAPVSAWVEARHVRARRWVRRHKSVVTAAAIAVGILGMIVLLLQQGRTSSALAVREQKNHALETASAEVRATREVLESNFRYARAATARKPSSVPE